MRAPAPESVVAQVDAAVDEVQRERERVLVELAGGAQRSLRLAELAECEAGWWALLVEHSGTRVRWRAALAAREYAQLCARAWRRRAACQQSTDAPPQLVGVSGE